VIAATIAGVSSARWCRVKFEFVHLAPQVGHRARPFRRNAKVRLWPTLVVLQAAPARAPAVIQWRGARAAPSAFEIERGAIMGSRQARIEPSAKLLAVSDHRHTLVRDRRQDRAADQDFSPGIALPVCQAGARDEPASLSAKAGERFINELEAGADFLGLVHG
jgi:hypothetical protein